MFGTMFGDQTLVIASSASLEVGGQKKFTDPR